MEKKEEQEERLTFLLLPIGFVLHIPKQPTFKIEKQKPSTKK